MPKYTVIYTISKGIDIEAEDYNDLRNKFWSSIQEEGDVEISEVHNWDREEEENA